jgi:hypothetical protein
MTEPTLPAEWQKLIEQQRLERVRALRAQAKAYEELAAALKMEATTLVKMAKVDNSAENAL